MFCWSVAQFWIIAIYPRTLQILRIPINGPSLLPLGNHLRDALVNDHGFNQSQLSLCLYYRESTFDSFEGNSPSRNATATSQKITTIDALKELPWQQIFAMLQDQHGPPLLVLSHSYKGQLK
jgi:hypothetical protein